MVCRVSSSMKGITDLMAELDQLKVDVDVAAANAVAAGGDVIFSGMRHNAPIGDFFTDPHPGQLKMSLTRTKPERSGNYTFVLVGMPENAPADLARYANAQEYGYMRGGKHYPPQSYIRKGFDEKKAAARSAMKESLKRDGKL